MQQSIPFMQIRGGSSKGLYFNAIDLPSDENERNRYLLLAMEGTTKGDPRQIDGLGGANSLTSKVAIVSLSENPDCDLDYIFIQVVVGKGRVSTNQTCGNILAGVLPFAIESGMILANSPTTSAKINIVNTGGICEVIVQTPNGIVAINGDAKVDGVVGTAAPIICNYLETVGSTCGALLPTGNQIDVFDGIETTCIDNGMPVILLSASAFGLEGDEGIDELEENHALKTKIESIRVQAGYKMNLGDVSEQTIPKMCLISKPKNGGSINTRMFIPHIVHEAIGVLAAVSVAAACVLPNSIAKEIAKNIENSSLISVEHPSGEFTVNLDYLYQEEELLVKKSGVIRTARVLASGKMFIND